MRRITNFICKWKSSINELIQRLLTGTVFSLIFWTVLIYASSFIFSLMLFSILMYILIFEWRKLFNPFSVPFWLIMPFYPAAPFLFLIYMDFYYQKLLIILFILVFSYDTGAFIIGKLFGRFKLAPKISPQKTWEGLLGGFLFSLISLLLTLAGFKINKSFFSILLFALIASIISMFGDLFESWLKRRSGLKDISNALPGHGGFLDRFDSILFTTYFFFLFRNYLIQFFGF